MNSRSTTSGVQSGRDCSNHGFALLIVLTLLAFLVALLVGLATYTRIETAIAGNTQRQAQARENALLALNVAVAQLQKTAGPDTSVTATGAVAGGQNPHYTGVWTQNAVSPIWLVSGIEATPDGSRSAERLVGPSTVGASNTTGFVTAPVIPIRVVGVPGQAVNDTPTIGGTRVGSYAWWIGDQGVKASVAVADSSDTVDYPPYDSVELRTRLRQQLTLGAGAATTAGNPVFDSREPNNSALVANQKVTAINQIALLRRSGTTTALGLNTLQQNFHAWSPNNFAVLANTKLGGLRQDLSIDPSLLGAGFASWADYSGYMEDPTAPSQPEPFPAYASDPVRRRYRISPPLVADGAVAGAAPVLAVCGLSFNIRTVGGANNAPLEVRVRWYASLWNPYSSALVPQDLRLEIEGLPDPVTFAITDSTSGATIGVEEISLYNIFGDSANPSWKFPLNLQWPHASASTDADFQTWLPGRLYTWISNEHSLSLTPPGGLDGSFYVTNFSAVAGQGDTRGSSGPSYAGGSNLSGSVSFPGPIKLVAKLYRALDSVPLASYSVPEFLGIIGTSPQTITASNYQFGFQFRLFESGHVDVGDKGAWLVGANARDPRSNDLPHTSFRLDPGKGDDPAQYQTSLDFADTKFLLDRTQGSAAMRSYDEDVPLFELPRAPLLSLGELQHLQVAGGRPFSIGNSWGESVALNGVLAGELFDRFYFSGLVNGVTPSMSNNALMLPNPILRVLPRNPADGAIVGAIDLRNASNAHTSKFLLQGGAFNLNTTNPAAWIAVLRGVRFPNQPAFTYLDLDDLTGTASDVVVPLASSTDAHFFRFSQSAQETYKSAGQSGGVALTRLFRQGVRSITGSQVSALSSAIAQLVRERRGQSDRYASAALMGPFRSLEQFLAVPLDTAGVPIFVDNNGLPQSLLERAIAEAGVNSSIAEFSSQWLTQGDIMTALAPVLFPRSDTFLVRTYGEVVNPATQAVEGRAWCEATVQRVPEYFDKSQTEETAPADLNALNTANGRRFKVVSFRWLTRSDI